LSRFEQWFAATVIRLRWPIIAITLLTVAALATGALQLRLTNSYRVFFGPDNPELMAFEAIENTYTRNDNVMFVVTPADGDVFSRTSLAAIHDLTARAWQLPYSNRVDSLTNFQYTSAHGDELSVGDLVPDPAVAAPAGLRAIALAEPLLAGNLVARDGRVTAVNVTFQLPRVDERTEVPSVVGAARALAADVEREHPGTEVRLTGVLMMDIAFSEASQHDAETLVALSFGLIFVLVGALVGGFAGAIGTAVVVGLAIAAAMGIAGYLGYPVSPPIAAAPVIILTVGVANCVHIIERYAHGLAAGEERDRALIEAIRTNFTPVFLASLTTVVGFLSFNFSEVPPIRQLGNIVAFGDVASYLLAVTLLPALLAVLPITPPMRIPVAERWLERLADFVIRRRRALLWSVGTLAVVLVANLPRNQLNDVFVHYFDDTTEFRRDADYTIANLTGLYHLHFSLDSGATGGIAEPAFLADLDAFTAWLRAQPEVMHVASLSDTMRRLNRNMHGDDPAADRLPGSRELAAQYLLLYEMSLPYGLDLNNQIDVDKASTKLVVAIHTLSSSQAIAFNGRAEAWLRDHARAVKSGYGTGAIMMFSHIGERNIRSMLAGTAVALVLISGLLLLMLRSVRYGAVSLVPNLLPVAMGFGLWGIIDGEVGLSLSVVASMTLGIIIDDTVHFLVKYRRARRHLGLGPEDSLRHAFGTVSRAMSVTSLTLVAGFLLLSTSHFALNAGMGLLTAIVIAFAAFADLLLLGPLLLLLEEKRDAPGPDSRPARPAVS
jgi:predicted RND superfamily exporter protein